MLHHDRESRQMTCLRPCPSTTTFEIAIAISAARACISEGNATDCSLTGAVARPFERSLRAFQSWTVAIVDCLCLLCFRYAGRVRFVGHLMGQWRVVQTVAEPCESETEERSGDDAV